MSNDNSTPAVTPSPSGNTGADSGTNNNNSTNNNNNSTNNNTYNNNNSGSQNNNRSGTSVRNGSRTTTPIIQSVERDFEGKTAEIGGVLALKSEKVTKKVPFDTFRDLIVEYLTKVLDKARDVIPIVRDMEDPVPIF